MVDQAVDITSRLHDQFEREKEYATTLKQADMESRRTLYKQLYGQLFEEFSDLWPSDSTIISKRAKKDCANIKPLLLPRHSFVEIGCGTGGLAAAIAPHVERYIGLDVADSVKPSPASNDMPIEFTLFNGVDLPLEDESVDIIYSNQVLEHLHTEDAQHQCKQAWAALKTDGLFIVRTPNRLTGPHDISRHFTDKAEGLHLHEYTLRELHALLDDTGFTTIKKLWAEKGVYAGQYPAKLFMALESGFQALPSLAQKPFIKSKLADLILNPSLVAIK